MAAPTAYDRVWEIRERARFTLRGRRVVRAMVDLDDLDRMAIREVHDSVPALLRSPYLRALFRLSQEGA